MQIISHIPRDCAALALKPLNEQNCLTQLFIAGHQMSISSGAAVIGPVRDC